MTTGEVCLQQGPSWGRTSPGKVSVKNKNAPVFMWEGRREGRKEGGGERGREEIRDGKKEKARKTVKNFSPWQTKQAAFTQVKGFMLLGKALLNSASILPPQHLKKVLCFLACKGESGSFPRREADAAA